MAELEADPSGTAPGRLGFDDPELNLHQAEADLALGHHQQPRARAEAPQPHAPTEQLRALPAAIDHHGHAL
ncbi:hypothetical protein OG322_40160 [Streptomyces sp. NBC_01260]|uniref:hypothetical protein n=1 Tax=unclassified Streptomyces TaxID=2593676 RepID=UPI000F46C07D|nr:MULTISPECIES: hypothetical protein [unclassified Streptomyces]MCX4774913.1 hypothetical protein [Streptomyces sp. NBC_01285]